jgi:hypothetical protein
MHKQAEIIHNYENQNVRNIEQGEIPHRKYKRLKHDGGHLYDCSRMPELTITRNWQYQSGTERSFVYIVYTLLNCQNHERQILNVHTEKVL